MFTPVTLEELDNARQDVESLEVVVNGLDTEVVNTRLGQTYPTLSKFIKDSQTLVQSTIDTVVEDNMITTNLISAGDGETQADKNSEFELLKFDTGITVTAKNGGVSRTQADKNSESVFLADYGAIGVGDETQEIQSAINANNTINLGNNDTTYQLSRLTIPHDLTIKGVGTLDFSNNPTYANQMLDPLILARGTISEPVLVTQNVLSNSSIITVSDTANFSPNDIIEISTPNHNGGFVDSSTSVVSAELLEIESVLSSTQLKLIEPVASDYGYSLENLAQVRKITPININIGMGVKVKGKGRPATGTGDYGLVIIYGAYCNIRCQFINTDYNSLKLESCYKPKVAHGTYKTDIKGVNSTLNYGVVVSGATKHAKVYDCDFYNMRHAVVTSHVSTLDSNKFYGVTRFLRVFENRFYNTWHAAVCTHNDADQMDIYRNDFYSCNVGVNPRERNIRITFNNFTNSGTGIYLSSHPKNILLKGNTCISQNGGTFIYGKFDLNSAVSGIEIIENNIDSLVGANAIYILNDAGVTNKGLRIVGNRIKDAVGTGGSAAMIRIGGQPIYDAEISDNRVVDYSNAIGIKIETGGDDILIKSNHVEYGEGGTAYSTNIGTYTKTYAVNNSAKGTGGNIWSGSAALANAATLNNQNTWY